MVRLRSPQVYSRQVKTIKRIIKMRKVKCTNCGYEFDKNVSEIYKWGKTPLIRMLTSIPIPIKRKKCVDIHCPNCENEFEYRWED